jgi:hypothetical protein
MNIRSSLRLAHILLLAVLRGSARENFVFRSIFRKPIIIALLDALAFVGIIAAAFFIVPGLSIDLPVINIQLLVGLPSIILFFMLMWGAMWELGQSERSISSDIISWLPLKPSEFVLGSSLSSVYFISLILAIFFGLTLALSVLADTILVWLLFVPLSILNAFSGAFVVEIIRAISNRVSSTFYKKGGRSAIFGSLFLTIAVIILFSVAFAIIFSPDIMSYLMSTLVSGIRLVWFIPMVWPSLALISNLEADFVLSSIYSLLTILFTSALFFIAISLRKRYWISNPVSVTVAYEEYVPKRGFLSRLGFTLSEAALIRKDFKSMTRRREILMAIAFPTLMIGIMYTFTGMFESLPEMTLIIPIYFSIYISITSIGQEGEGVLNIYSLPIKEKEILKGKFGAVFIPSITVLISVLILSIIFMEPTIRWIIAFLVVGTALIIEANLWGIAMGARYADFNTIPRARFISPDGSIMSFFGFMAIIVTTGFPILFYTGFLLMDLLPFWFAQETSALTYAIIGTIIISIIVSFLLYRFAKSGISKICREHRV